MKESLKIYKNGQWELEKNLVVPAKEGGVQQDVPQPEVGNRGKQGRMQPQADNDPNPKPPHIAGQDSKHRQTATGIGSNRGDLGIKTFGPNGEKLK